MNNLREKLVDLIIDAKRTEPETGSFTEYLADHLIANGVTFAEDNNVPALEGWRSDTLDAHAGAAGGGFALLGC